jgi:threonine/homoserine/homoserine lactone efflux protein
VVPLANLLAFTLIAVPFAVLPGPSVLFVIGRSLALGRTGGLLSVLGNAAGALLNVIAVAVGIGFVIAQSVVLFTVIKVAGALYLVYLGVQTIRHRHDASAVDGRPRSRRPLRLLVEGFFVGASNPKTILFLIAILPQFVDYRVGAVPSQLFELGAAFIVIALISDSVWVLAAGLARDWFGRSPRRLAGFGAAGGIAMIGLGVGSLFLGHPEASGAKH